MIPLVAAKIAGFFAGKGLKFAAIGVAALSAAAAGAYVDHKLMSGKVAQERTRVVEAQAETAMAEEKRKQAEDDYKQLREQVAEADRLASEQTQLERKAHEESMARAKVDADKRITSVLDRTKRMLLAAESRRRSAPEGMPQSCSPRGIDDPSVERQLIGRAGECAQSEERLKLLQRVVKEQCL